MASRKQARDEPRKPDGAPPPASSQPWRTVSDGVLLPVRLTPKSAADAVAGASDGPDGAHLLAKVRALPSDGAANQALLKLVAKWIGLPQRDVTLASGGKSRLKTLHLRGAPVDLEDALRKRLERPA